MFRSKRSAAIAGWILAAIALNSASGSAQELPVASPDEVGFSPERLERLDAAFRGYADDGRIGGAVGIVVRDGRVAYSQAWGMRDSSAGDPQEVGDIFRIESMTQPITSVAVLMLYEEGGFLLTDPVGDYLPELRDLDVAVLSGPTSPGNVRTRPSERDMTIEDLLRHTAGLSEGRLSETVVDMFYRERRIGYERTLGDLVTDLGDVPLVYEPGTVWHYSLATEVLGRLVEVVSGRAFDEFLRERILEPLGMTDTGFYVPADKRDRFARQYGHSGPDGELMMDEIEDFASPPTRPSGGSGLVSTARDYARFAQMLLNGGELDGVRILNSSTVESMTVDRLPDGAETGTLDPGWGFGLGVMVKNEMGPDDRSGAVGTYRWFGDRGTAFWVDPERNLIGVFMMQLRPNLDLAFGDQFRQMVDEAVVD